MRCNFKTVFNFGSYFVSYKNTHTQLSHCAVFPVNRTSKIIKKSNKPTRLESRRSLSNKSNREQTFVCIFQLPIHTHTHSLFENVFLAIASLLRRNSPLLLNLNKYINFTFHLLFLNNYHYQQLFFIRNTFKAQEVD